MCFHYRIIKKKTYLPNKKYITYGILAIAKTKNLKSKYLIEDITNDRKSLLRLIKLCNKHHLHISHLHDVVDDFLYKKGL